MRPAILRNCRRPFGWRAGRFMRAGRRASYPLRLTRAAAPIAARAVLIGNAAQALHPVAGQGFNLGLRDAAMLAEVIADTRGDVGAAERLQRFAAWRARDRGGVVRFTDGLVKLFGDTRPGAGLLRNLGLLAVRSHTPGQERAGARQRRFRRPDAAPGPRAAGAACVTCAIVGGGPVGACAAALLARGGTEGHVCSSRSRRRRWSRTRRSMRAWWRCRARASARCAPRGRGRDVDGARLEPYERMRIWHAGVNPTSAAVLVFDAADVGEPNLGYILENRLLQARAPRGLRRRRRAARACRGHGSLT